MDAKAARVPGGFSGIIVDLFAKGELLPQLTQAGVFTWCVFMGGVCMDRVDLFAKGELLPQLTQAKSARDSSWHRRCRPAGALAARAYTLSPQAT